MGQIFQPGDPGIKVRPTDRQSGPAAGAGASGNNSIFLGANAGLNSAVSNVIAIGNNAANAGIADAQLNGSTVLGAQSLQSLTQAGATVPGLGNALVVIGQGNLQSQTRGDSSVIIGQGILPTNASQSLSQSVLIGNAIGATAVGLGTQKSVLIGYNIMPLAVNGGQTNNVVIGWKGLGGNSGAVTDSVLIGNNVGATPGSAASLSSQSVIIGSNADAGAAANTNVAIGYNANARGSGGGNVVIGGNASTAGTNAVGNSVIIGMGATENASVNGRNIILGPFAGFSLPASASNQLVIEQNVAGGGAQKSLIYGDMGTGNLIVGNSVDGTNRDLNGTNTLKLLNGTKNLAPVGGGYFYVSAGALHWVGSAGTDTTVAVA